MRFAEEGWICMYPFKMNHYMVERDVYSGVESGSLCGEFGWMRGEELKETIPAPSKPVCKKCERKLTKLRSNK